MNARRIYIEASRPSADAGIRRRYPIEKASWVAHPLDCAAPRKDGIYYDPVDQGTGGIRGMVSVVDYRRKWIQKASATVRFHVSADQRYTLFLDGERISMGPDRCDVFKWAFATLEVDLAAGEHEIEAEVVWLPPPPVAQISRCPGFIFMAEGASEDLATGAPGWTCALRKGAHEFRPDDEGYAGGAWADPGYLGAPMRFAGSEWFAAREFTEPAVIASYYDSEYGIINGGWLFEASRLPEQVDRLVTGGTIRAVFPGAPLTPVPAVCDGELVAEFQALVSRGAPVTLPPHTELNVIWELDTYYCGYPHLKTSGGSGARIAFEWAEALFEEPANNYKKGDRAQVVGKYFLGHGELFDLGGGKGETYSSLWWRAGRYIRLRVITGDAPVVLEAAGIWESRYPMEAECAFSAAGGRFDDIFKIAVRGMQMCSHEIIMDGPHYEQLPYDGDGRLELLTLYALMRDDRLAKRVIELFAWSTRTHSGFAAERYPSHPAQLSVTYAMIWVWIVRDYLFWRGDRRWLRREILPALRLSMESFLSLAGIVGLLGADLPGWSFMDWVEDWSYGNAPGSKERAVATVNFMFVKTLRDAADVEDALGDDLMARRYRRQADASAAVAGAKFWRADRGLFAEDEEGEVFTEHAQCLALLAGCAGDARTRRGILDGLVSHKLAPVTVYFSFYVFDALHELARDFPAEAAAELERRLGFWDDLARRGFKTPVEKPEPSRSDCHAWGSHPLFHMHATIAGVRPASAAFETVEIRPMLRMPYETVEGVLPHPRGEIRFSWRKQGDGAVLSVSLPEGVKGRLVAGDFDGEVSGLENHVSCRL